MKTKSLWAIVDVGSGQRVTRLGVHGSRESVQAILDLQLSSFDVKIKPQFEVQRIEETQTDPCSDATEQ